MQKQVVGWGVMEGDETCRAKEQVCNGESQATCYVLYPEDNEMTPSCKLCTPPQTCEDKIADSFEKSFNQIFRG